MAQILLIEDEANMRSLVKRILECDGHTVTAAESVRIVADVSCKAALASAFDLAITDIVMPYTMGLEAIILLKAANPACKIVAVFGGDHIGGPAGYLRLARDLGADETIEKPFSVAALLEVLEGLLVPKRGESPAAKVTSPQAGSCGCPIAVFGKRRPPVCASHRMQACSQRCARS